KFGARPARLVRLPPAVEADRQVVRQVDARDWPGFDSRRVEQREESPLGRAVEALHDQPAVVVAAARARGKYRFAGRAIGAEIVSLRRAGSIVEAIDARVDRQFAAEREIADGVFLQRRARIDNRKFVSGTVDDLLAQRSRVQIDAIATQLAGCLGGAELA